MIARRAALLAAAALALGAPAAGAQGTTTAVAPPTGTGTTAAPPPITPAQAGDGILLSAEDRVELATTLADATEETGVCFGYQVDLGGSGTSPASESLSNLGPDRPVDDATCSGGSVVLRVSLTYTSSSSEAEDSASSFVEATGVAAETPGLTQRVKELAGAEDDGDLLGDDDDLTLRNLAAALPLALDGARPVALATTASAPNGDRVGPSPGSDWLRQYGALTAGGVAALVVGILLVLGGRGHLAKLTEHETRVARRRRERDARDRRTADGAEGGDAPSDPSPDPEQDRPDPTP